MKRILTFIGLITCLIGLYYSINYIFKNYESFTSQFFYFFGIIAFVSFLGFIILRLIYGKNWIIGSGKDILIGSDLISAINQTLDELPKPSKTTLSKLGGHLIYRFTRLGIIGLFLAAIPIYLLWQQNQKLEIQNKRISTQNSLIESERRSSLVFLMGNVLDKLDDEIKSQQEKYSDSLSVKFSISEHLSNRIIVLSKSLQPYKTLNPYSDELVEELRSVERGHLLTSVIHSRLDSVSQNTIVEKGNFSYSELRMLDFSRMNFAKAYFDFADLFFTKFNETNLKGARLFQAEIELCDFQNANLYEASLSSTKAGGANFTNAVLSKSNLERAVINGANFTNANLAEANLSNADVRNAIFKDAILIDSNLSETNFVVSQLVQAKSLFRSKNLNPDLLSELRNAKPCLFTEKGCN